MYIVCRVGFMLAYSLMCGENSREFLCLVKIVLKKFCQVAFTFRDCFEGRGVPHFILARAAVTRQ